MKTLWSGIVTMIGLFISPALHATVVDQGEFGFSPSGTQQLTLNGSTVLSAVATGWYFETGWHDHGISNYFTGDCGSCGPNNGQYNSFFVFNVPLDILITSASLSIGNPVNGYASPNPSETLSFWDVTTDIATLTASQTTRTDIYSDLGSGTLYGSRSVNAATDGTQVVTSLNSAAITALNGARNHQIAIGGSLNLTSVPEPSTLSLIGLGFIGTLLSVRLRRRPS